jgi:hypothetical protein
MAKTLAGLLREFNVRIVPISQNYRRGARETCAGKTLEYVFRVRGYDNTRSTLMTFCETLPANKHALVAPTILAVSDVIRAYPDWVGAAWFEAFDSLDLGEMFLQASANRRIAAPRALMATLLFEKLRPRFPARVQAGQRRPAGGGKRPSYRGCFALSSANAIRRRIPSGRDRLASFCFSIQ